MPPPRHTRTKKFKKVSAKAPYAATTLLLRRLLTEAYDNSQAALSEASGLSLGLVYRLNQGDRDPTAANIGAIIGALSREHKTLALDLITTYLQDVADETHHGYQVAVEDLT